jgi:hypothetical protein
VGETREITSTASGLMPAKVQDLQNPKGKSYSKKFFLLQLLLSRSDEQHRKTNQVHMSGRNNLAESK